MIEKDLTTIPLFYKRYVDRVKHLTLLNALQESLKQTKALLHSVPEELGDFKYQEDKWSIKELLCHMMDAERIFAYRALRFSRNDKTPLSGFDENSYVPASNANVRSVKQIIFEMDRLRSTTVDLFANCTKEMLQRTGASNNVELSVEMIGYIIAGHELHHCSILQERYLIKHE